jgi:hypothetical protein
LSFKFHFGFRFNNDVLHYCRSWSIIIFIIIRHLRRRQKIGFLNFFLKIFFDTNIFFNKKFYKIGGRSVIQSVLASCNYNWMKIKVLIFFSQFDNFWIGSKSCKVYKVDNVLSWITFSENFDNEIIWYCYQTKKEFGTLD